MGVEGYAESGSRSNGPSDWVLEGGALLLAGLVESLDSADVVAFGFGVAAFGGGAVSGSS